MRKFLKFCLATAVAVLCFSSTVFAGSWKENQDGWYWEEEDGSYPVSSWKWLDGDQNGDFECYYFNDQGYLVTNSKTPDGNQVDENGCWTLNGVVQIKRQGMQNDAMQLYQQAQNKTNNLDSFGADIKAKINMSISGMNISGDIDASMKLKNIKNGDLEFLMDMHMNMLGETASAKIFYKNDYIYMDSDGTKVKTNLPFDTVMKQAMTNSANMMQASDYLRNLQMNQEDQGNYILTFNYDLDSFNKIFDQLSQTTGQSELGSIQIKEIQGSCTVNPEGYFLNNRIIMKFDMEILEEKVSYDMDMTLNYINPGQPVDFVLPSIEGYQSI